MTHPCLSRLAKLGFSGSLAQPCVCLYCADYRLHHQKVIVPGKNQVFCLAFSWDSTFKKKILLKLWILESVQESILCFYTAYNHQPLIYTYHVKSHDVHTQVACHTAVVLKRIYDLASLKVSFGFLLCRCSSGCPELYILKESISFCSSAFLTLLDPK